MPTPTYTPLANITLGSSVSSVTFSSINQGFRDLILISQPAGTTSSAFYMRFNNDSGSTSYGKVHMSSNGSSTNSASVTENSINFSSQYIYMNTDYDTNWLTHIMDYSATDKQKAILSRINRPAQGVAALAGRYDSTSAITTINLLGFNFEAGSTFALYGIAA